MRVIITVVLLLASVFANAQRIVPIGGNRATDTGLIVGSLKVDSILVFPAYRTTNENIVLGFDSRGKAVLRINNDSLIYATRRYVDSGFNAITAGSVDSSIYTTVTRLADSLRHLRTYVDSNNTIIYSDIATLQSDIVAVDSAVGVAFGAISDLYDTLPNYVPYLGAATNVNLGTKSLTTNKVLADTLGAKSSMGIHIHSTGGKGIMVGAGGGGNITFDDYPTTTIGDSLLATNSSGGVVRYDMKGKLSTYLLKSDTTTLSNRINLKLNSSDTASLSNRINLKGSGTVTSVTGGYALTGGTITTTGTFAVDSTLQATRARVKKQIDSVAALSGGGGGSPTTATSPQVLYKSGSDTLKGANVVIDSTDRRLVFPQDTTTSTVHAFYGGGTKVVGSNRMGISALRLIDTVSIPAALQRAINTQITGSILPQESGNLIQFTGTYAGSFPGTISLTSSPAIAYVNSTYSSTSQQSMYSKSVISTTTAANISANIRVGSATKSMGLLTGNTKFSGGGGRGTFMFCLPSYNAGERIGVGYTTQLSAITTDISAMVDVPLLFVGKDAADATFNFFHGNNSGGVAPTKVAIPVTPNQDDVYRVTIYVAPNSTFYMQFDVIRKTGAIQTFILNPTTDVPAVGSPKMVATQFVNNASTGVAVTYGLIQHIEEIY